MDNYPANSTFPVKRKPVAGFQLQPDQQSTASHTPTRPDGRTATWDVSAYQLSIQTTGLAIDTSAGPCLEKEDGGYRPPLPPRSRTPMLEPVPVLYRKTDESPTGHLRKSRSFGPYMTSPSTLGPSLGPSRSPSPSPSSSTPISSSSTPGPNIWQSALTTTKDFALNLLPLNTTSNKHYTILLHTSALILYRGSKTSLTLTVFSSPSHPLPPPSARTLQLQPRGYTGDTGSRLKSLIGLTSSWIDVTPVTCAASDAIDPGVTARWDKEITRTSKRLSKLSSSREPHIPRETHVVRIPASASDGYFRLVLCLTSPEKSQKHKILISSPTIRIASLSSDISSIRGAGLRTLPLEAGVKVAGVIASNAARAFVGPVAGSVRSRVQQFQPGTKVTAVGGLVYGASGLENRVVKVGEKIDMAKEDAYRAYEFQDGTSRDVDVIGPDDGPSRPFPVSFQGRVVRGTGKGTEMLGIPTANLSGVPEDVKFRLKGVYFGWARVLGIKGVEADWHESIISFGPSPYASPSVVAKTIVAVHLLHSFDDADSLYDAKLEVVVLGFLRPMAKQGTEKEELLDAISQDLWLTMASLAREKWGPEPALEQINALRSARSFEDRVVGARERVQTGIDRIPAHWVGVRTGGAELRDRGYGNGGYWIQR